MKVPYFFQIRKQKVKKAKVNETKRKQTKNKQNKTNFYFQVGIKTWSLLSPQQLDAKLVKTPTGCD